MPRIAPAESKDVVLTGEEVGTNDEAAKPATTEVADKPFLVLIADPAGDEETEKIENVILKDERIALGSRAFRAVRMSPEDASNDPLLAKHGKESPRFVLVSADYKSVT